MLSRAKAVYLATRKRHDQLFNTYFMRPIAGGVVVLLAGTGVTPNQVTILSQLLCAVAAAILIGIDAPMGAWLGIGVLELSYLFDCCDGMLARHKKIASKQGHLFDFFTDESKALMLVSALAIRLWRTGGWGIDATVWAPGDARYLIAGIVGAVVVASATSLTNFVRRPEISGQETPVEAHYETQSHEVKGGVVKRVAHLAMTFLRFLNHYPSHIWVFAAVGRLDVFFWIYATINLLYLGKGWVGLLLRFGRA